MKVVAVNGSPRKNGNTALALATMKEVFAKQNIAFEILEIGGKNIRGCTACGTCYKTGKCVLNDEAFDEYVETLTRADGIVLAAPIYYANIAGTMKSFLDRVFYSSGKHFYHKVGGAFATVRRTGGIAGFDTLTHYMSITEMLIAPMPYWGVVHGTKPEDVAEDKEGLYIVQRMAENMAWLLQMKEQTKNTLPPPIQGQKPTTSFIR